MQMLHTGHPPQPTFHSHREAHVGYLRAAMVLVEELGAERARALADRVEDEQAFEYADEIVAVLRWLAR